MVKSLRRNDDPEVAFLSFLGFLAEDIAGSPHRINPLDKALVERIDGLVGHLPVNPHEDLGDESLV